MKKIEHFVNRYPLSKTLRFSLIPQGKTLEHFEDAYFLEDDEKRAEQYEIVKGYIDRYHKAFIERVLTGYTLPYLTEYAALYNKSGKSTDDAKRITEMEHEMRKSISERFTKDTRFKPEYEALVKKCDPLIKDLLPRILNEDEKAIADSFRGFTTYFRSFCEKRKNMYTGEGHATEIAFRIVDQNLPRFLDNCRQREKVLAVIPQEAKAYLQEAFSVSVEEIFDLSFFHRAVRQSQIDIYNQIIGGYTEAGGVKKKGINEYINEHNQTAEKKIPMLKPLYKQILSDRSTASFIPEKFADDSALLAAIRDAYETASENTEPLKDLADGILCLMSRLGDFDLSKIHVRSGAALTSLSKWAFGAWDTVQRGLERQYDRQNTDTKNAEKHREAREKYFKGVESVDLRRIQSAADEIIEDRSKLDVWFAERTAQLRQLLVQSYDAIKPLLCTPYPSDRKLCADDDAIAGVKAFLDCLKDIQSFAGLVSGSGKEAEKDELFYGDFLPKYDAFSAVITPLYDKVRNYVTQKPYSADKVRLNFDCSSFLHGWSQDYSSKSALLFRKGESYYLGIVASKLSNEDVSALHTDVEACPAEQICFDFQKPDVKNVPRLFIRSKGENFAPAVRQYDLPIGDILEIYDEGYYKPEYRKVDPKKQKESLTKLIDYYKLGFARHESYRNFNFSWKESSEYSNIPEFCQDTIVSCYSFTPTQINFAQLMRLTDEDKLYLFRIYAKDFSENSHGTPNLHTLYFRELFSPENMKKVVFKLSGGAEMFYRRASIGAGDRVIHPANQPIKNKNPNTEKKTSTFDYDMIKDRRYTVDKFFLHLPIEMNFCAVGRADINAEVRQLLRAEKGSYVIGIDRGERNLLYICVVDPEGNIVEQHSLNEIVSNGCRTDYHRLLDERESARLQARRDWKTIEGIKELKEGYISQVIHVICQLMEKYDAIIAMEDLSSGFKNSRSCVEKQVYQKFEKMLIDKLNFYADKTRSTDRPGSIRSAYQLTNRFESFAKMGKQNGFIFYIPAWLTSKIDPTTGFVDLLKPRYESVPAAQRFFSCFDRIAYNAADGLFRFDIDYAKFPNADMDCRKKWTVCSFGKRIESFRNPEKNSSWDTREIDLTEELHRLFSQYDIDESAEDLREQILARTEKDFFFRMTKLVSLMLQMRNSVPNTSVDYLISPVRNSSGAFFCTNDADASLPADADANGAYHIALKALWAIRQIADCDGDLFKVKLAISNKEWLEYAQSRFE